MIGWTGVQGTFRGLGIAWGPGMARHSQENDFKHGRQQRHLRTAKELRTTDPKQWTQAALAKMFGVDQKTVSRWFETIRSNRHSPKATKPKPKPDARVKITEAAVAIADNDI